MRLSQCSLCHYTDSVWGDCNSRKHTTFREFYKNLGYEVWQFEELTTNDYMYFMERYFKELGYICPRNK